MANGKFKKWWKDKIADNFRSETRDDSEGLGRFLNGVDNFWNRITGSGLTDAEREANKYSAAQAEEQYNREVEFYEKYQSPKAMMQQGVNPFSINGSAGGHTASGGSPSSVSPQGAEGLGGMMSLVQSIFGMVQQKRMNDAEISFMGAQERNQNSEAFLNEIDALTRDNVNKANLANIYSLTQKYGVEMDSIREAIQTSIQSRLESVARVDLMKIEGEERKQRIENMKQELSNMALEALNIQADTDFKRASIDQIGAYINNLNADTDVKEQMRRLVAAQVVTEKAHFYNISAQTDEIRQRILNIKEERDILKIEEDLKRLERDSKNEFSTGYHDAMREIQFFINCFLGWWSGSIMVDGNSAFRGKPKKIGFK